MRKKTSDMTLEQLQKRLREAHARIGFEGRFAFTIDQSAALSSGKGHGGCYITHWFRPTPYAFEDCKAVGSGSVADSGPLYLRGGGPLRKAPSGTQESGRDR